MKIHKPTTIYFALLISLLAVSCKKETTNTPKGEIITVAYHISCKSESAYIHYLYPQNGKMVMIHSEQNKAYHVISFETTAGQYFSVEAENKKASRKNVTVQILINGEILDEATSDSPSDKAIAHGNF